VARSLSREDGASVCERCLLAETPLTRLKGLLGRDHLKQGEGLLLRPASSIHTFFMRFSIDVVWLDRDLRVLEVTHDLRPWRTAARREAKGALELPAGQAAALGLAPGDRLALA
jgi:uncharacterized protein